MPTLKKIAYDVRIRRIATGEVHTRLIFACDASTACQRAIAKARRALGTTFVERQYGEFQVVSCERHLRAITRAASALGMVKVTDFRK